MEYSVYVWLKGACPNKIKVAFIGCLPKHLPGYATAILLDALCKILYRAIHPLELQGVFHVSFLLALGDPQELVGGG